MCVYVSMKGHMKRNMKHAGKLSEGRKATRGQLSQGVPKAGFPFIFNQHSCLLHQEKTHK